MTAGEDTQSCRPIDFKGDSQTAGLSFQLHRVTLEKGADVADEPGNWAVYFFSSKDENNLRFRILLHRVTLEKGADVADEPGNWAVYCFSSKTKIIFVFESCTTSNQNTLVLQSQSSLD